MKLVVMLAILALPASLPAQIWLKATGGATSVDLSSRTLPREFARATTSLGSALTWDSLQPGLERTEFTVEAGRLGMNVRIILARIEPSRFDFKLVLATKANGMTGAWNVSDAPLTAALAINAGQFKETGPWGWLVLAGTETRDPGFGPLSLGIIFDSAGRIRWLPFKNLAHTSRNAGVRYAFQSYPTLLFNARVPQLATGRDLDQSHRDARLILAEDAAGRMLVVLTRYDALRGAVARVPIGLTVPESIALVGALGARHAVMLDGGVSAQMVLRGRNGRTETWKGMRDVPLALVAFPRAR
ncbi:MAG TPA: phosphodiester glycosidase family protein [Longimicrobiales bacterium]